MDKEIKSGKEILDDFFKNLKEIPGIDKKIADVLTELYQDNKFTKNNISNSLLELRTE